MTTVMFVHGTGVREESYHASYAQVQKELSGRDGLEVTPCYWGDLGAELHAGLSIPDFEAGEDEKERDYEVNLWGVLYEDPFYELRILKLRQGKKQTIGLGQQPPGKTFEKKARKYQPSHEVKAKLEAAGLASTFEKAKEEVVKAPVFRAALEPATEELAEYRAATARAWLAQAIRLQRADGEDLPWIRAEPRDALVELLIEELGGYELGLSTFVKEKVLDIGTAWFQKNRGNVTGIASSIASDILLYQGRGKPIQQRIRTAIEQAAKPVVVLAHSLGGVASVDLLAMADLDVQMLITAGSQAPFFHEIGALQSLERGKDLPVHFPTWLNIYDPRDFLSYIGENVFPDRVRDVRVDNGQPFPASHSAYWENDDVWIAIGRELP